MKKSMIEINGYTVWQNRQKNATPLLSTHDEINPSGAIQQDM